MWKCITDSENEMVVRIGLHCSVKHHAKPTYERIYRVFIMKWGLRGITQYCSAFTKDKYIAKDLADEPWTSNIISGLHTVSSGRHVALGPGARENSTSMEESALYSPERTSTGWQNFWFDAKKQYQVVYWRCILKFGPSYARSQSCHYPQEYRHTVQPITDCVNSWSWRMPQMCNWTTSWWL